MVCAHTERSILPSALAHSDGDRRPEVFGIIADCEDIIGGRHDPTAVAPVGKQPGIDREVDLRLLALGELDATIADQAPDRRACRPAASARSCGLPAARLFVARANSTKWRTPPTLLSGSPAWPCSSNETVGDVVCSAISTILSAVSRSRSVRAFSAC